MPSSKWLSAAAPVILLVAVLASNRPPTWKSAKHQTPLLPRPEVVKALAAPYRELALDYYWVQLLEATTLAQDAEAYRDLYYYARLISDLEPQFRPVYQFAGAVIPFNDGSGVWQNARESTDILQRGVVHFPQHAFLRVLLAYNWFFYLGENLPAARLLEDTAELPGAPAYVRGLAAKLYADSGRYDVSLSITRSLLKDTDDERTRGALQRQLRRLRLEKALADCNAAAEAFRAKEGRGPSSIGELVGGAAARGPVRAPGGETLEIGSDGRCHASELGPGPDLKDAP